MQLGLTSLNRLSGGGRLAILVNALFVIAMHYTTVLFLLESPLSNSQVTKRMHVSVLCWYI